MKRARSLVSIRLGFLALPLFLTSVLAWFALLPAAPHAGAAPAPWSDSLTEYGMPASPIFWQPSNWDVQIHTRDRHPGDGIDPHMADHGADCGAPPAQHQITTWQQGVFICRNHVMTAIADDGYGEVTLTPDHMADWSNGPVTIGFSVSTQLTSSRDWITVDVSPFTEQLALPFSEGGVDLQGMPAHYIEARLDNCANGKAIWRLARETGQQGVSACVEDVTGITPSAVTRTPFELVIWESGYLFRVAASAPVGGGKVLLQGNWTKPLSFTQGVVQFSQHSYNPSKCEGCRPNTWHWSNFSISSAVPYTLLRPTSQAVVSQPGGVVTFGAPAPAGSFLKFAALGSVQVSYDGGKTYSAAQKPPLDASLYHDEHATSYLTPVPAGARSAQFKLSGGWYGSGMARDFSIVSSTTNGSPPPTQPPGPQPTATQPSGSPPIPLNNTPCMVEINGVTRNGTCSGTFNPGK